jgi:stage III sporulation protein AE
MKTEDKRNDLPTKRLLLCLTVLLVLVFGSAQAWCAGDEDQENISADIIRQQADSDGIRQIEDQLRKHSGKEAADLLEGYDPRNLITDAASGRLEFNVRGIASNVLNFLLKEIYQNIGLLIKIVVLVILCALLKNLQTSFMSESVGEVAFFVCYIVIVSVLLVSFSTAMTMGMEIIDGMVGFMYATVPVLITLLVTGGNITSGGIFQPVMLMVVEVSATVIKSLFMPLIFLSTILSIINNISDKIQLSRLTALIRQITGWALGAILTVFIAVVSLQGSMGAVVDGVTSKAAKFAISAFIPVVGKTLSDAADTVVGCTLLIKNAAGLAVMIGVIVICIVPLLKILALVALYKAASALLEPISEKRITSCINEIAGSMIYIFSLSASVAFMFLISVTALISAGNMSAMIR